MIQDNCELLWIFFRKFTVLLLSCQMYQIYMMDFFYLSGNIYSKLLIQSINIIFISLKLDLLYKQIYNIVQYKWDGRLGYFSWGGYSSRRRTLPNSYLIYNCCLAQHHPHCYMIHNIYSKFKKLKYIKYLYYCEHHLF